MTLPGRRGWLLRPVGEGMCRYESLKDGTLDLADVAEMNDFLDMRAENDWRVHEATKRERGNG
ncbi:hypothetical protein FBZ84_101186 [Azospirillum baldaniorum]|uniref:DUF6889 family protein n=1 Tax=Azospirillum baldaniorum TaxID=1064539 RepID=UPI0011AC6189|nr:hypothetical protein [Azospirillum baldaniorum]TWA71920.1 hypothetical protein FBZ84_101186 [Azospirillum baldaniorum]